MGTFLSCSKKHNSSFQVSYINAITGQPMKGELILFSKYKYGLAFKIEGNSFRAYESVTTDENGIANFSDVLIKESKKFKYDLSIKNFYRGEFISNDNKIKIEDDPSGKTYMFNIEPAINKITIRPKDTTTLQLATFEVKAECMFVSSGLFHGNFSKSDNIATTILDTVNKEYTKWNYPMGNYKIQIVRSQNNLKDTLLKDVYINRNEEYLFEFEF